MNPDETEPAATGPVPDAEASSERAPARTLLALAVALAIAAVVLTGIAVVLSPPSSQASGDARPKPSDASTVNQAVSPLATVAPSIIPADCAEIYTRDWQSELAPFELNPAWTKTDPGIGTTDDALRQLLEPGTALTCHWAKPSGGSDSGLVTTLANVDERAVALAQSRIANLGWACTEQFGGVRCVTQGEDANGTWGESHFFRDGVWIATRWSNLGPDGYTADIASTLWP